MKLESVLGKTEMKNQNTKLNTFQTTLICSLVNTSTNKYIFQICKYFISKPIQFIKLLEYFHCFCYEHVIKMKFLLFKKAITHFQMFISKSIVLKILE